MSNELQLAEKLKALEKRVRDLERLENGRFSGARVYNSTDVSIPDSTFTAVAFDSERFDTDTYHSTGSNTSRLTAPVLGKYSISGHIRFAANATGQRIVRIQLNGSTTIAQQRLHTVIAAIVEFSIDTKYELAAGDYVTLEVWHNSGGSLSVLFAGNHSPEFAIARLG